MRRVSRRLAVWGLLLASLSCGESGLEPLPLQVTLEASRTTATVGQIISFVVTAQGGNLLGVTLDYGNNTADQRSMGGARTARVTFEHSYGAAGSYTVRATVIDVEAGAADAEVSVLVQ